MMRKMRRNAEGNALLIGGVVVVVVVLVLSGLFYTGNLPGLNLLDDGTDTKTYTTQGVHGAVGYELIGPNNRKGFICSYIAAQNSEDIVCQGKAQIDFGSLGSVDKYAYKVYLKKNAYSSYELVSAPGIPTSSFISNANPGEIPSSTCISYQNVEYLPTYSFNVIGSSYSNGAVKIEIWGHVAGFPYISWTWAKITSDEAYLFSGWGGLYLPKDANGTYQSTFEIGEHVKINVQTSYGAYIGDNTWRVTLQTPSSAGGTVYKTQDYGNNVNTYFEFDVTQAMYAIGDNDWTLQIYNTLVPKGTLHIDTIDFRAKAPSDVSFSQLNTQYKVGNSISCTLSATVNSGTQLPISKFKVAIIYGTYKVLLPSDPLSQQWLLQWSDVTASGNKATITFTPKYQSYVTIHAKAYDSDGRASLHTMTDTIWVYSTTPAVEDQIKDEVGVHVYGGGSTNPWFPWDPGQQDPSNWLGLIIKIIITIIIFICFLVVGIKVPLPFAPYSKIIVILLGALFAYLYYALAPLIVINLPTFIIFAFTRLFG